MLKISWLLELKMKLKQLQSLGVTKNLIRFSKANKKATLAITSKGLVTLIMESLPQSHRHEKIGLSVRYPRKMYCPSPSALQYLPQGSPFHHSLSFHEFILRNISSMVPLLVLLDQPISLAGYVRQRFRFVHHRGRPINDNIVQEGQTPVPENHITANCS
ncbi:uncharacterized protein LOC124342461 isoform X1 [Daphnia pulicaria]|uniref:uncharacterized protein LOC124316568 isoform X1 n=1 Tax=Daphnia pulicaria TaxID=35523 RepID=UPI001EEABF35|nr:uncharacterized protein LOC124316568 isoform X1 [Daphnia pulicaria]XP_046651409.1 uncharacterized protein LOC124342461 isoform X1 [Daphnia pulicaria]XP_046651410.1 uncharacterized protein LOC124342461 isoform X1 [Daphnia pulicaria]